MVGDALDLGQVVGDPEDGHAVVGQVAGQALQRPARRPRRARPWARRRPAPPVASATSGPGTPAGPHRPRAWSRLGRGSRPRARPSRASRACAPLSVTPVASRLSRTVPSKRVGRWKTMPTVRRSSSTSSSRTSRAAQADRAAGGIEQPVAEPRQRRLAGAGRSQHHGDAGAGHARGRRRAGRACLRTRPTLPEGEHGISRRRGGQPLGSSGSSLGWAPRHSRSRRRHRRQPQAVGAAPGLRLAPSARPQARS